MKRLLALAWASLALAAAMPPAQAETVKIGYLPLLSHLAYYADELGMFKKYGLDAEVKPFQAGPALAQAVLSGDYQGGEIAVPPMINLAIQGTPVYFLTSGGSDSKDYPAGVIMIRPDDDSIHSFKDLKGKKLGQLAIGTLTYMRLFVAARHYGMKRDDFQEIFVPFGQMAGLLASKQVDAVYSWPPFDTLMEQAGLGKRLVDDSEWVPYSAANGLVVGRAWADKNPETAKKLSMVWIETSRWLGTHPEGARAILPKRLGLSEAAAKAVHMPYWPKNGFEMMPSIWDTYYLMVDTKLLQPAADPKAMIEDYWIKPAQRFIAPAVAALGAEPDSYADKLENTPLPNLPGPPAGYRGPWTKM